MTKRLAMFALGCVVAVSIAGCSTPAVPAPPKPLTPDQQTYTSNDLVNIAIKVNKTFKLHGKILDTSQLQSDTSTLLGSESTTGLLGLPNERVSSASCKQVLAASVPPAGQLVGGTTVGAMVSAPHGIEVGIFSDLQQRLPTNAGETAIAEANEELTSCNNVTVTAHEQGTAATIHLQVDSPPLDTDARFVTYLIETDNLSETGEGSAMAFIVGDSRVVAASANLIVTVEAPPNEKASSLTRIVNAVLQDANADFYWTPPQPRPKHTPTGQSLGGL